MTFMTCVGVDRARESQLRFIFDNSVISMAIGANTTFGDIALTLGALSRRPRGAPVAIDVTLAAPRSFEQTRVDERGPTYRYRRAPSRI
jgi:hypothetical protein